MKNQIIICMFAYMALISCYGKYENVQVGEPETQVEISAVQESDECEVRVESQSDCIKETSETDIFEDCTSEEFIMEDTEYLTLEAKDCIEVKEGMINKYVTDKEDIEEIIDLLKSLDITPLEGEMEDLYGGCVFEFTDKSGKVITVGFVGCKYMLIDEECYEILGEKEEISDVIQSAVMFFY